MCIQPFVLRLPVHLPFDEFIMGVFRLLNVAPTKLHPNKWGGLQAFRLICQALYLSPTPESFLYFYITCSKGLIKWLSLIGRSNSCPFDEYSQSFKKFKNQFFKGVITLIGKSYFYNDDGRPKFPFYWMIDLYRRKDKMSKSSMSTESRQVVEVLEQLSRKISIRSIVHCYLSPRLSKDIRGEFTFLCSLCDLDNMKQICISLALCPYRYNYNSF